MEEILEYSEGHLTPAEKEVIKVFSAQMSAREHFQRRVVGVMKQGIDAYATEHPDRMLDQRHKDGTLCSWAGMSKIFEILNEYNVNYRHDIEYEEVDVGGQTRVHNGRED